MLPMMALRLPRRRGWSRLRVREQQDCGPGRLAEVEVRGQVAEDARVLANVGARVESQVVRLARGAEGSAAPAGRRSSASSAPRGLRWLFDGLGSAPPGEER